MFSDDMPIMPGEKPGENFYMRIAELSELTGVPKTTIHFYMREGLLHPPFKTSRTMAYYDQSHLDRLLSIQKAKAEMNLSFAALKEWIRHSDQSAAAGSGERGPGIHHSVVSENLKNERREKIIEAAIEIFSRKSFHYASVKDVAKAAGISTGTFYLFFPDKLKLLIAVLDKILSDTNSIVATKVRKQGDPVNKMEAQGRIFVEFFERIVGLLYKPKGSGAENVLLSTQGWKMIFSVLLDPMIKQIQEDEEHGIIRKTDPELLAYALMGTFIMMSIRKSLDQKYSEERLIRFLADLTINGIGPIKPKP